jgi:hypothetical protein
VFALRIWHTVTLLFALTLVGMPALAAHNLQVGPFVLGGTSASFTRAAKEMGLTSPRKRAPQARKVMAVGLMRVQPIESNSQDTVETKISHATGYLLSGRLMYLSLDYNNEDPARAQKWFEEYNAPLHIRKHLQDTAWFHEGAVIRVDRFGRSIHLVDWKGLHKSNRVNVTLKGAVNMANRFFREIRAQQLEASLELIRQRVISYFSRSNGGNKGGRACSAPPAVDYTPAPNACDTDDKRFSTSSAAWQNKTWKALGLRASEVSRHYSYAIQASGTEGDTRIVILGRGDLDCDHDVATMRIILRANPRADRFDCTLDEGRWEISNPLE